MFSCHCRKWWYYILDFDCNDKMNNRKDKIPKSLHSVNFKTLSFSRFSLTFLRILDFKVWANDFMSPKITHLRSITSQTRHHSRSRHLTVKNGTQSSIPKQSDPKIFSQNKKNLRDNISVVSTSSNRAILSYDALRKWSFWMLFSVFWTWAQMWNVMWVTQAHEVLVNSLLFCEASLEMLPTKLLSLA